MARSGPAVDVLLHRRIGGKAVLYVDRIYGCGVAGFAGCRSRMMSGHG
jgi:hypothetical protein